MTLQTISSNLTQVVSKALNDSQKDLNHATRIVRDHAGLLKRDKMDVLKMRLDMIRQDAAAMLYQLEQVCPTDSVVLAD